MNVFREPPPSPDASAKLELFGNIRDDVASPEQLRQFEQLIRSDNESLELYLRFMRLHAILEYRFESVFPPELNDSVIGGGAESAAASPPTPLGIFSNVYHGTVGFFSHEAPLSMLVAAVVMTAALYLAWIFNINHYQQVATRAPTPAGERIAPDVVYVGHITGMKDCRWSETDTQTVVGAAVSVNRRYALASGLLEITYKSGARVILEGPCTYQVESSAGGYLARGKLTARINSAKPQAANPEPRTPTPEPRNSSLIPHPSSFVVTTPTAIVTDLGTEFGVEVAANGDTTSHVFQGSVIMEAVADGLEKEHAKVVLKSDQSAMVQKGEAKPILLLRSATDDVASRFTRGIKNKNRSQVFISQSFDSRPFHDGFTFSTEPLRYSRTIGGAWRLHYLNGSGGTSITNKTSYSGDNSVHVERLPDSVSRLSVYTERLGAPIASGRLVASVRLRRNDGGGLVFSIGENLAKENRYLDVDIASPAVAIQPDGTLKVRRYDAASQTWSYNGPLVDSAGNNICVPANDWIGVKIVLDYGVLSYDVWCDVGSGLIQAASNVPTDGTPVDCMGFNIQGARGGENRSEIWIDDVIMELDGSGVSATFSETEGGPTK